MDIESLKKDFFNLFQDKRNCNAYFAPARVNLIGEHIDYNGGYVLPIAIDQGIYLIANKRNDSKLAFYSKNLSKSIEVKSTNEIYKDSKNGWLNYPLGVIYQLLKKGLKLDYGFNAYIYSDIKGSGLSSSAALELVFATMLIDLYDFKIDKIELVKECQNVECNFLGLNCGIMDQFASCFGKKDNAILLNCATLKYEYIPFVLDEYSILVTDSNIKHKLNESHYNDRLKECKTGLRMLQKKINITNLCDLSIDEFNKNKDLINDEIVLKRVRHAISEQDRVKKAVSYLKNNNLIEFGKLVTESGISLKDDYECTLPEIDYLVNCALDSSLSIGSRLVGGGWGGNIISICKTQDAIELSNILNEKMKSKYNHEVKSSVLQTNDGARILEKNIFKL